MAAPNLTFSVSGAKISGREPYDRIIVAFSSDIPYTAFECRATKVGDPYGIGRGTLIASFSQTPAATRRQLEIYDDFLVHGDGEYRVSLFAQGEDGSWNDNYGFIPSGAGGMLTADGETLLCMR